MLLSMTGHGEAHCQKGSTAVLVEVRTFNSRYFKLSVRTSDGYTPLEPRIEAVVRHHVRRGTVQVNVRVDRQATQDDYRINENVLLGYQHQLARLAAGDGGSERAAETVRLASLLVLPGVVEERVGVDRHAEEDWLLIEPVLIEALEGLAVMRRDEGSAMALDLRDNCRVIAEQLEEIAQQAPQVVESYRQRLADRINKLLAGHDMKVQDSDFIREVGTFADRCDISEEVVRLRSHLEQFEKIMEEETSTGRKLEFVTQEMFRETNTIGAKANDARIARNVIEIKTAIERMREMIQNVE